MNVRTRLTKEDKEILLNQGHIEDDFSQIERALNKLDLKLSVNGKVAQKTTIKNAIEKLGQEVFLSGLSRAAFHWNCSREITDISGNHLRFKFDASKLFK